MSATNSHRRAVAEFGAVQVPVAFRFHFKDRKLVRASFKWGKNRWRKMEVPK